MTRWTPSQVTEAAPDASRWRLPESWQGPGPWPETGSNDILVWGKCQGSGKTPYQVSVDLTGPAYRCSCPSRKFPCKHGLALLLLWVARDDRRRGRQAAAFADEWASRARRPGRRAGARGEEAADPAAQAKRLEQRLALMDAGVEDFWRWLADLVRSGLAAARNQPYSCWDTAAARLVDAQLPGAGRAGARGGVGRSTPAPTGPTPARRVGRWWTTTCAWRRAGRLDADEWASCASWSAGPRPPRRSATATRVPDRWTVLGAHRTDDGRLQQQRTWLRATTTARSSPSSTSRRYGQALAVPSSVGAGSTSRSPAIRARHRVGRCSVTDPAGAGGGTGLPGRTSLASVHARPPRRLAGPVARPPPGAARRRRVCASGEQWPSATRPASLPMADGATVWTLLALTGGEPVDVFGELEAGAFRPLSVVARRPGGGAVSDRSSVVGDVATAALVGTARREPPPRRRAGVVGPARTSAPSSGCSASAAVADALTRGGATLPARCGDPAAPPGDARGRPPTPRPSCSTCCSPSRRSPRRRATSSSWSGCGSPTRPASASRRRCSRRCSTTPRPAPRGPAVGGALGERGRWLAGLNAAWAGPARRRRDEPGRATSTADWVAAWPTLASAEAIDGVRARRRADRPRRATCSRRAWSTIGRQGARRRRCAPSPPALGRRRAAARGGPGRPRQDRAGRRRRGARPAARRARAARMAARLRLLVHVRGTLSAHLEVEVPDAPDAAAVRDGLDAPRQGRRPAADGLAGAARCAAPRFGLDRPDRPGAAATAQDDPRPGRPGLARRAPCSPDATPSGRSRARHGIPDPRLLVAAARGAAGRVCSADWVARPRRVATSRAARRRCRGRGPTSSAAPSSSCSRRERRRPVDRRRGRPAPAGRAEPPLAPEVNACSQQLPDDATHLRRALTETLQFHSFRNPSRRPSDDHHPAHARRPRASTPRTRTPTSSPRWPRSTTGPGRPRGSSRRGR